MYYDKLPKEGFYECIRKNINTDKRKGYARL